MARIGKLRQRGRLQRRTGVRDAEGGLSPEWATFATVWCNVVPVRGEERLQEQRTTALIEHQVECLYLHGVHPSDRLVLRNPNGTDRVLSISAVMNKQERTRRLVLTCTEAITPIEETT